MAWHVVYCYSSNSHSPSPPSSSNAFSLVSSEQDNPSTSGCRSVHVLPFTTRFELPCNAYHLMHFKSLTENNQRQWKITYYSSFNVKCVCSESFYLHATVKCFQSQTHTASQSPLTASIGRYILKAPPSHSALHARKLCVSNVTARVRPCHFFWCTCICVMHALQQRTVRQS